MRTGIGGDGFLANLGSVAGELTGVTRSGGGGGCMGSFSSGISPGTEGGDEEKEQSVLMSSSRRSSLESYRLGTFLG